MIKTALNNANTSDIIYSMAIIAPAAIKQAVKFNLPEIIGLTGGDLQGDAILTGQYIRQNIKYKVDPFTDQNIQLPSALLRDRVGDCKSFSMLFLAIMEAAGYNGGFRFAAYRNNNFTHVYNYFLDNNNNVFTFDACIKGLKENQSYTKIKDMRINYIAGAPVMINEINKRKRKMNRVPLRKIMLDDRYASLSGVGKKKRPFFKKLGDKIKKGVALVKTVALAPARGPFLVLVSFNVFGMASKFTRAIAKNKAKVAEFWTKLGGDDDKLFKSVATGAAKKPFLVSKKKGVNGIDHYYYEEYIGVEPATITTALTTASGLVAAAMKLFKSLGIKTEKGEQEEGDVIDPETPVSDEVPQGEDFFANDPASEGAAKYAESGGKIKPRTSKAPLSMNTGGADTGTGFKPSPLLIGGAAAAVIGIYLLTKKKK
jgi:hypothetical protein